MTDISTKVCVVCKKRRRRTSFNKNRSRKDGVQSRCKLCDRAYARGLYRKGDRKYKKAIYTRRTERLREKREWIVGYLRDHPCVDCGERDIVVLEFDHMNSSEKVDGVMSLLNKGASLNRIKREVAKCVVRCANCHRRRTSHRFNWWTAHQANQVKASD